MSKFDYNTIDEYQLEITTYCNAACPQCPRNNNGSGINPHLKLEHLSRNVIDSAFPADLCGRLRQIFFCGSYGDPIMHPDFLQDRINVGLERLFEQLRCQQGIVGFLGLIERGAVDQQSLCVGALTLNRAAHQAFDGIGDVVALVEHVRRVETGHAFMGCEIGRAHV